MWRNPDAAGAFSRAALYFCLDSYPTIASSSVTLVQRVRNAQPQGGLSGNGISPESNGAHHEEHLHIGMTRLVTDGPAPTPSRDRDTSPSRLAILIISYKKAPDVSTFPVPPRLKQARCPYPHDNRFLASVVTPAMRHRGLIMCRVSGLKHELLAFQLQR